jgi:hypothetical protein
MQQLEIYNMLGEKIFTSKLSPGSTQVNIGNEPKGIYLCRISSANGVLISSNKLVIE